MIFHFVFVTRTDNRTNSTTVPNTFPRITYYEHYRQTDALMIIRGFISVDIACYTARENRAKQI